MADPSLRAQNLEVVRDLQLHIDSPETAAQSLRKVQGVMFQNMIPEPKKKATRGVGTWGEGKGTAFRSFCQPAGGEAWF